jgi:uncharacterized protein
MDYYDPQRRASWTPPPRGVWNYHLIEVLVFLFLIVPSMALSLVMVGAAKIDFSSLAVGVIFRDLGLAALVFYFIWRNRESLPALGWTRRFLGREVILGLLLFLPVNTGAHFLENFLAHAGLSVPRGPTPAFLTVHGPAEVILGFILVVIVALAEETIFRGYLLLRFRGSHLRPLAAALLSSFIFALGHGYEGSAGIVTVGALGLVFALVYLWRGSLVAPVIMHFLQDFSGLVLPALLK